MKGQKVKLLAEVTEREMDRDTMGDVKLTDHILVEINNKPFRIHSSDLTIKESLGSGLDGSVFRMIHKETNFEFSTKTVQLREDQHTSNDRQNIAKAVMRLTTAKSPYLIRYYGVMFPNETEVWICKELMDISLGAMIERCNGARILLPENLLAKVAFGVLSLLEYLDTTLGILHRRVKPGNILINRSGQVKLSCKDWNILSDIPTATGPRKNYTAPERLEGDERPNSRGDVWSLGICLIEAATGQFPYAKEAKTVFEQLYQIVTEPSPRLIPSANCSEEFCDFVAQCLIKEQKDRPRPISLLNHTWLSNNDKIDVTEFVGKVIDNDL